jgi:UPF0148 protein
MKNMAELLRSGAKMLSYNCPECGSPLFELKTGEIWCAKCQRRVVIISEDADEITATRELIWDSVEKILVDKLSVINKLLSTEIEPLKVNELTQTISVILTALEKIRRMKKT